MTAPGRPGIAPTWTTSAKDAVTTALGPSRLWATLGHGIVNEIYWPATGQPQTRDLGFIVAGPSGWFEVKRVQKYSIQTPKPYVPLPTVLHEGDGYQLRLEVLPDPLRDVLLVRYALLAETMKLYVLLAPHLDGSGTHNTAWVEEDLLAEKDGFALALRADTGFSRTSAGYVGASDGWQDFAANGRMTWDHKSAENGNVALMGELSKNEGVLALGLAATSTGARTLAGASIAAGYESGRTLFVANWENWAQSLSMPAADAAFRQEAEISATVLKVHQDRTYPGAVVASLSVPWGNTHDDPGGYHLVWTRDAVESAFAFLAVGQTTDACQMLSYLIATQSDDGSWAQNFYPDGRRYWSGIQLDEIGFPILLASKLRDADGACDLSAVYQMVERAAVYLVRNGPVSPQDRWEENPGASPFTLAVVIAALVAAAEFLEDADRSYLLSLADCWNERIEEWTYVEGGPLCEQCNVDGYYVRIGSVGDELCGRVEVKNRTDEAVESAALVGMEFLSLARFGLRRPDDPRIQNTLKVVEEVLRIDTLSGVTYHRYNGDGYGEHEDGRAFDGTGVGRGWPLLTGERGHLEVQLGRDASQYLKAMVQMASPGGLIPEQVWDREPIPSKNLFPGKPSGSAMPLVWAHAEFLKLLVASAEKRPVEMLEAVAERYLGGGGDARTWHWRSSSLFKTLPHGRHLSIECLEPFVLHVGFDGWTRLADLPSAETQFGMHAVQFDADALRDVATIDFTFYYPIADHWEHENYAIVIPGAVSR